LIYKLLPLTFQPRYGVLTVVLLAVEIAIARYIHTGLIRSFVGDVLVVVLLYVMLRTFLALPAKHLAGGAFVFACCIETAQAFNLVDQLGLYAQTPFHAVLRVALGATFDWWDFAAYTVGYILSMLENSENYIYKSHK
jgi:ABC-type enterochelin transport system permease subunit